MLKIEFPKDQVEVRQQAGGPEVFDPIRKKWLRLSPEEWVRQHMIRFLVERGYPAPLMAVEKKIAVGALNKRCDLVVYQRDMQPFMIVECKALEVTLTEKTLQQILRYHIALPCPYLLVTNGKYTFCYEKGNGEAAGQFLETAVLPSFPF